MTKQLGVWVLLAVSLHLISCTSLSRTVSSSAEVVMREPLVLLAVPERSHYKPGEALVCKVYLHNISGQELVARNLNARSVSFWKGSKDKSEIFKFEPVFSRKENMLETKGLAPNGSMDRTFVLTTVTQTSGTFTLQALYDSAPDLLTKSRYTAYSPKVEISVEGPVVLQRDRQGVLLKEDAIKIAKERVAGEVKRAEAVLVKNEAGFLDWWVLLHLEGETGEGKEVKRAFLVNPYLGLIRSEVEPTTSPPKKEVRDFEVRVKK